MASDKTIDERVLAVEIKLELLERQLANLQESLAELAKKLGGRE
jgi:hypothetical protein